MYELCKAIKARLDEHLVGFVAPVPGLEGQLTTPQVHIGGWPPNVEDSALVPAVAVVVDEGEDGQADGPTEHYSETQVDIFCTIMTAEQDAEPVEAGHALLMALTDRIRRAVRAPGPLADRFKLLYPVTWTVLDFNEGSKRAHPFYGGHVSTRWREDFYHSPLSDEDRSFIHGNDTPGTDGN